MHKTILKSTVTIFFLALLIPLFAQNKVGWEGTVSGDYIIYKDTSWKEETYLGFLYYDPSSIGAFLYLPSKALRITILFAVEDVDGELVLTGQKITSPRNNDELYILGVNYLMDILPALYNRKLKPNENSKIIKRGRKTQNTEQFGSSCTFYYASHLPLFYLESVLDEKGMECLTIEKIGRISKGEENIFFNFEPIKVLSSRSNKNTFKLNEKAKREKLNVDGITFTLDSQWTKIADNLFFMKDIAFLTINKIEINQLNIIPNDFNSSFIKVFSISRPEIKLLYRECEFTENKNGFTFSTIQYDSLTHKKIKDIKTVIKNGKEATVVSLTVDYAVYSKYKSYFDLLF